MPRRAASAIAARFASGSFHLLSSKVPSISSAISFTAMVLFYPESCSTRGSVPEFLRNNPRKFDVLNFLAHDFIAKHHRAGVFCMWQETRCFRGAAFVYLRPAAAGSL